MLVCLCVWQDDGWKLAQSWHLVNCELGANHRPLRRHLASITVELVFGLTTAEQVDAGQFSSSTCSCSKWNTDEAVENSFDCICNSYVCMCKRRSAVHECSLHTHTGLRTCVPAWTTHTHTTHNLVLHQPTDGRSEIRSCQVFSPTWWNLHIVFSLDLTSPLVCLVVLICSVLHWAQISCRISVRAAKSSTQRWLMCSHMYNVIYYVTQQTKTFFHARYWG